VVFQKKQFDPMLIALAAAEFTGEFISANKIEMAAAPAAQPVKNWCPPLVGMLKLNVDAGVFKDSSLGCGMVARDNEGNVKFAATKLEKCQMSPTMAEAIALRWCLQWKKTLNIHIE
jgi:hypothetical protein